MEELAAKVGEWAFEGLELACWGDHFEVDRALAEPEYCVKQLELLRRHELDCWANLIERGHTFRLQLNTADIVRRAFEISGLLTLFDVAPTRKAALEGHRSM